MQNKTSQLKVVFFGTPEMAVDVLDEMLAYNIKPEYIITKEDKAKGRGLDVSIPRAKEWALRNNIPVLQPPVINETFIEEFRKINPDIAIVAGYGKILPKELLTIPKFGFINVHPSLLPKYRGATPVQSALLNNDKITGVTLFEIDEKMDHGYILSQMEYKIPENMRAHELLGTLSKMGGKLIPQLLLDIENNNIKKTIQDDTLATYCKKINKEDGEIKLSDNPDEIYAKFRAYDAWPGIYYFLERNNKKIRVIITDMTSKDDAVQILKVKPEGKKEMSYEDFKRGN